MGSGESGPMDLGGAKRSRSPLAASPVAFWLISPVLPAKPSAAGSPGKGGARERSQFSPSGGNGDKRTQGELARRAKRRWPGPLRRRAAMGKVGRRPEPHPIRAKRVSLTAKSRTFQFQFSIYQPLAPYFSRYASIQNAGGPCGDRSARSRAAFSGGHQFPPEAPLRSPRGTGDLIAQPLAPYCSR